MALSGTGAVPGSGGLYTELTSVTRRAFVPRLFVQLYYATPTLFHLLGNAQKSAGGVNQITISHSGSVDGARPIHRLWRRLQPARDHPRHSERAVEHMLLGRPRPASLRRDGIAGHGNGNLDPEGPHE